MKPFLSLLLVLLISCRGSAQAETRLASPFGDGMVVQHDRPAILRGWDRPGQVIHVTFEKSTAQTQAGTDGSWEVEVPPPPPGGPYQLVVEGSKKLHLDDVLSGEVWLAAGQSNMHWPVSQSTRQAMVLSQMPQPEIRFYLPAMASSVEPQQTVAAKWQQADAKTVKNFSAVAYLFAKHLVDALEMPVGILQIAEAGADIKTFLPIADLKTLGTYEADARQHAELASIWRRKIGKWRAGGKERPRPPHAGGAEQYRPSGMENAMLHPIKPFQIRGVIWYQGESNIGDIEEYPIWFTRLVKSWRRDFRTPNLPVFFVQLPDLEIDDRQWAEFRPMQEQLSRNIDEVDMAVIIGAGTPGVHPPEKGPVADRLARLALAHAYGRELLPEGPRLLEAVKAKDAWVLKFDRVGEGLRIEKPQDDQTFQWVRGDEFLPVQPEVLSPSTLRFPLPAGGAPVDALEYNMIGDAIPHVFNSENLPASPFRIPANAEHELQN